MDQPSPFKALQWRYSSPYPYHIVAGPCSAESLEQVMNTAKQLQDLGITTFRASLWKPRTRPGGFEGVGEAGIPWLKQVADELGMQVTTEVAMPRHIEAMLKADLNTFWIGARTTSSPFAIAELVETLRGVDATVLVKNPINPDVELWEGALLRFASVGLTNIAAIHRGFSTYGQSEYRNPPLWQIPLELKRRHPQLTMLADPSHIGGKRSLITSLSQMAIKMHFEGLIIEIHPQPDMALSDRDQQITPRDFADLLRELKTPSQDSEDDTLRRLRVEIDKRDEQLLAILTERMAIADQIGSHKSNHNLCVVQPDRFRGMMQGRIDLGKKLGLSESLVHQIFSAIHEASVHIQSHHEKIS